MFPIRLVNINMAPYFISLICILSFNSNTLCQEYFSKSIDIIQESESGWQIIRKEDNYYVMAPSYCASSGYCTSIIKLNNEFEVEWKKTFEGILPGSLTSIIQKDSFFLIYGITFQPSDTLELSVIKFNAEGEILDQWYYGTTNSDSPKGIEFNTEGGFYIVVSESTGFNKNNLWIFNCDINGNILWKKQYGDEYSHTNVYSILNGYDSKIVFGGAGCFEPSCEIIEGFALLIDSLGNIDRKITSEALEISSPPFTYAFEAPNDLIFMSRYTLSEFSGFEIPIIYKYNSIGEEIWSQPIELQEYSGINRIKLASNGDIIGVGFNENHPYIDTTSNLRRELGGWLFRMNPEGVWIWNRIIGDLTFPGPGFGNILDVIETDEGNFLAVGSVLDTLAGSLPSQLSLNVWLLHLDSTGCIIQNCNIGFSGVTSVDDFIDQNTEPFISIYPNPAEDFINVKLNDIMNGNQPARILITDNLGRIRLEDNVLLNDYISSIYVKDLPRELYYLSIITKFRIYNFPIVLQ